MTTSRDGPKVTRYPGEVRAGELAAIKRVVERVAEPGDALLFVGDFNTPPTEVRTWRGRLDDHHATFDTGFDDGAFAWAGQTLRDAFEADWRDAGKCTSRNGDRTLWIDYMYHSTAALAASDRSDVATPPNAIPDLDHPSDHLPLRCAFTWV